MPSLKTALIHWEILRIPYNLVLLALGLVWSWPLRETMKEEAWFGYWGSVFAYGLTANVFYTLGPAVETYLQVFKSITLGKGRWGCLSPRASGVSRDDLDIRVVDGDSLYRPLSLPARTMMDCGISYLPGRGLWRFCTCHP